MSDSIFNRSTASDYLKVKYAPAGLVILNSRTDALKRLPKRIEKFGDAFEQSVQLSLAVSAGSGEFFPDAVVEKTEKVRFDAKRLYATGVIDRYLTKTAVGGETAFIDSKKHKFEQVQKGFAWNIERQLFTLAADGLGTVASVVDTDPTFVVTVTAASFKPFNWEVGMKINFGTSLEKFTLTVVDKPNLKITVTRDVGGVTTPTAADVMFMQNSKDAELVSFADVLSATSGSLYGVPVQDRWQADQQTGLGQTITEELLDNAVLDIADLTGSMSDDSTSDIILHTSSWKILKSQQEGLKTYTIPNSNVPKALQASLGLTALQYFSPVTSNPVPIYTSRFMKTDEVFGLNFKRAKMMMVHNPMFFDDDGSVLNRTPDRRDTWEFIYGMYAEMYMQPAYQFLLSGLTS